MKTASPGTQKNKKTRKNVDFEYFAPNANKVELASTFNNWNPEKTPLQKEEEGKWKVSLDLKPGRYEYRYRVDGEWQNDQRSAQCVPNIYGTWNCVIEVN